MLTDVTAGDMGMSYHYLLAMTLDYLVGVN